MARRNYSTGAARTTLSAPTTSGSTSITVTALTGYPASTPWTAIIDAGTATEEVVQVTGVAGTTLTVTRGFDGSTAFAHLTGASFRHGVSAIDFDEPNDFLNNGGFIDGAVTIYDDIYQGGGVNVTHYNRGVAGRVADSSTLAIATSVNYSIYEGAAYIRTGNATGNVALNLRGSASVTMESLATKYSVGAGGWTTEVEVIMKNGATPYSITSITVDSAACTVIWPGGAAPAGTANKYQHYVLRILRTGTNTYTVFVNMTALG